MVGNDDTRLSREELVYIAESDYAASWVARRLLEARSRRSDERVSKAKAK